MSALGQRFFGGIVAVLAGLALTFQFPTATYAADTAIDETNFPDTNFRNYVSTNVDSNNDGILQQSEADKVFTINIKNKSITSLKGVEHFTKLEKLYAIQNRLTDIDVSHNTNLTWLDLSNNQLAGIDVSANTNLTKLILFNNQLTDIDVSANTNLTELSLGRNQLTGIDVSANTNLTKLILFNNQLTGIDVSANTNLTWLNLDSNKLAGIDVSANTNLTWLNLDSNKLTDIDVSANTNLTELDLESNQLTAIDLSHNTNLTELRLSDNKLTDVDVSANTNLTTLGLGSNQLTDIDVSHNTNLTSLDLSSNQLTDIDVSHNTNLTRLDLEFNQLTDIDVSHNTNLTSLYLHDNKLTDIDVSANTNLTDLNLAVNKLTAVDLSAINNLSSYFSSVKDQSQTVRISGSSRLVPVNQLSAGFDAGKVSNLIGATIVDGLLQVDEGATQVTYSYATGNGRVPSMPVTLQVTFAPVYTVSFDMGGHGTQVAAQSVEAGKQASAPAAPSAEGREFKGWYTDNTFTTPFDFTAPINTDVTVYAKWETVTPVVYTVSFDMGGHGTQVAAQSVEAGKQASAPAAPSAEGREFKGWYTDNTFTTPFDFTAPINTDVTVYAKWETATSEPTGEPTTNPTDNPTGKPTTNPTNQVNEVTPKRLAITGADSSWFALLGAVSIAAGWLLLLRRRA
ncbi:MAG: leucine-rich repeat domain-containing protein [Schaalia turicensis]